METYLDGTGYNTNGKNGENFRPDLHHMMTCTIY